MKPKFFPTPGEFRVWLARHHDSARELVVGFHKKDSGKPSITWPESVDEALCYGWIDGVRRRIDDASYSIRFTPRKARSNWSAVNVARVAELTKEGRMQPAGLAAFAARAPERTGIYAYEQRGSAALDAAQERAFRANRKAWAFWEAQPPGYRKLATWFVVSAKKDETRQKRLARLIEDSAHGRRITELARPKKE
jgi:uncharacterized protein YdeI (YjbR/CyaY-like superfamily)